MLIPIFGAAALGAAWWRAKKKTPGGPALTPTAQYMFTRALDGKLTSASYRTMADFYEKQGWKEEANVLRKRADWADTDVATKDKCADVVKQALASTKPDGIRKVADFLAAKGAIANASRLKKHADAVEAANAIKPQAPPSPEPVATEAEVVHTPEIVQSDLSPIADTEPAPAPIVEAPVQQDQQAAE